MSTLIHAVLEESLLYCCQKCCIFNSNVNHEDNLTTRAKSQKLIYPISKRPSVYLETVQSWEIKLKPQQEADSK